VTGGQVTYFDGGARFTRSGGYDPVEVSVPNDTGLVNYAGIYIGLSNVNRDDTDLAPIPSGISPSIRPYQASVVNGSIFITVSFGESTIKGAIYDRILTLPVLNDAREQVVDPLTGLDTFEVSVPDLILTPTTVASDGSFSGSAEIPSPTTVGSYGGIIGGADSEAIADAVYVEEHFEDANGGEEEYGIFVIGQCGTAANTDPALCASGAAE